MVVIVLFLAEFEKVLNDVNWIFIRPKRSTRCNHKRLVSAVLAVLMVVYCINFLGGSRYSIWDDRGPNTAWWSKVLFANNCGCRVDFIGLLANHLRKQRSDKILRACIYEKRLLIRIRWILICCICSSLQHPYSRTLGCLCLLRDILAFFCSRLFLWIFIFSHVSYGKCRE